MLLTSIAIFGIFIVSSAFLFWRPKKYSLKSSLLPPGPRGYPLVGHLPLLVLSTLRGCAPFFKFAKWAFEYGPICYLRFGQQKVVVISDARVAHELCVQQAENFSTRPRGLLLSFILRGKGIVFNDGPAWKEHRTFITQEFRKFGFSNRSIESRIQLVVDELLQQLGKNEGKPHDPHLDIATATYNIIWEVISGYHFQWDDPLLEKLIKNLETNLDAVELVGAQNYVMFLMFTHLLWHNPMRLLSIVSTRFWYFRSLINEAHQKETSDSMITDYLDRMKTAQESREETSFSRLQLLFLVSDLFIAGGETTVTTLRWAILRLAIHQDFQEKIYQQLCSQVGRETPPTYAQRVALPYLEAFVHEVLRIGAVPGMWRNTNQDAECRGYHIPKNTWVLLHFWAMGNDPNQWENSDQFQPERFLHSDGSFKKDDHLLAFSIGKRQCPGEALSRTELFIVLAALVQKYRISLALGSEIDNPTGHFGVTYTPPKYQVIFSPR